MLKRGQWSVEELTKLRESYGRRPLAQLARELRRTAETVRQRAGQLFAGRLRIGELTQDEVVELRRMVGVADVETMALVLGRLEPDVLVVLQDWAHMRRKGRFQPWETEYLKACYASRPDWAVTLVLGRGLAVVRKRAKELCLGKDRCLENVQIPSLEKIVRLPAERPRRMPRWSDDDVRKLCASYAALPNLAIARELGRSVKSVVAKANELGLKKNAARLRSMGRENVGKRNR